MRQVLAWLLDALPDISNLILVLVGVLMSMPKLAEDIEKRKPIRYSVASFCIGIGIAGFVVGINQKRQFNSQIAALVDASSNHKLEQQTLQNKLDASLLSEGRMEAELKMMTEIVGKPTYPAVSQIAAALKRELAERTHDQTSTQGFSIPLLTDAAHRAAQRIRDYQAARTAAETNDGRVYADGALRAAIADANYLREQMVPKLLEPQTNEDHKEAAFFGAALAGEIDSSQVVKAANYLDSLTRRIVPPAPTDFHAAVN